MRLVLCLLTLAACQKTPPAPAVQAVASTPAVEAPESIGEARMESDGTIVLQLRASGPVIGDAAIRYPPDHEQYRYILEHVGGLQPGMTKSVPPFPD